MINVEITGKGNELLLIHGIMSDRLFFHKLASELENDYKLIMYDRKGYGERNPEPGEDLSVRAQADEAADILNAHATGPAFLIGHSAGGLIGLEVALRYPELVQGLVLIETPLALAEEDRKAMQAWNAELNEYVKANKIVKVIPAFYERIGEVQKKKPGAAVTSESLKRIFHNLEGYMQGEFRALEQYEPSEEYLKEIAVPVYMFVTTEKPDSIYTKCAEHTAEIMGWKRTAIAGNHNVVETEPEEFLRHLRSILP